MKTAIYALLVAVLLASSSAHAANIWSQPRYGGLGGTVIFISGRILPGDAKIFDTVSRTAIAPVYVQPSGPDGSAMTSLAIGDMIAERGFNTVAGNGYECISGCALIWASGYANHALAHNSSMIRFHSCASYEVADKYGRDDMECNTIIMKFLLKWGYTVLQARWAVLAPHETTLLATKGLAASLGFRWQWLWYFPGVGDSCRARLCIIVP
jgi:hypothetical protein